MLKGVSNPSESHQLPVEETNMTIPTDLVTMVRRTGSISQHDIVFMTRRIAEIIADVQREDNWQQNWWVLNTFARNPETREIAGKQF
jgi:hypothetical protein